MVENTIDVEKLKYLYGEAENYKNDIKSSYNETYELTDPFAKIYDSGKREKTSARNVDSVILKSKRFLVNFIMSSVFSRSGKWASLSINQQLFKELTGTQGEVSDKLIEDIEKVLDKNSDVTHNYNETTNYYTETVKALTDCVLVGTGCRKIVEMASSNKPFTYEYQSLDNLYILEDSFGVPGIVFKRHYEKNGEQLTDMFSSIKTFALPPETPETTPKDKINVIEYVVPSFDETKAQYVYIHGVYTEGFDKLLGEEVLNYNPFTVFRWEVESSNPWGVGIARANIDLLKELKEHREKRAEHRDKIVDPPVNFFGNIELIHKVSMKPGAKNYGGDGFGAGNNVGVQPINMGTNLIPIDQDIMDCRDRVREVFMAQPIGDVGDTKGRSATEMQLRHELFRKEFSGAYELLNTEMLGPTFLNAYIILQGKDLLQTTEEGKDYTEFTQIQYINELTKSSGMEDVRNTINFYMTLSETLPESYRKYILKPQELVKYAADKLRISKDVVYSSEEIQALIAQEEQLAQAQALAQMQQQTGMDMSGQIQGMTQGIGEMDVQN